MGEFIIGETEKEEEAADTAEKDSKDAYDEMMSELKTEEEELQSSLVDLKKNLADAELSLEQKREELSVAKHEKVSIEKYLKEMKPGCDFITVNFDTREANRAEEAAALEKAVTLIKDTPAYKKAAAK